MKSLSVGTVYDLSIQILIQLKSISNIKKLCRSNYWLPTIPLRPNYCYGRSTLAGSLMGRKIKTMGSTTLDREDLDRGAELDKAYYIQNQAKVAGKTVDLKQDPPPDLVVEVDITHTDIDKLALYAKMGVPEFWRYNGEVWRIYQRSGDRYQEVNGSPTFPFVPKTKLYEFLAQAQEDEIEAEQTLRQWLSQCDRPIL
ncbi:MAG: Uma2 family endonuclease [Xenococcaceae cyanobacterium]